MADDMWSNPFEVIDLERAGIMPPSRATTFDLTFQPADLVTSQVADWMASGLDNPDYSPLQDVAAYLDEELTADHVLTLAQAMQVVTQTYVDNNDELFWEETKSPDASERLDDCQWESLAFYFAPAFEHLTFLRLSR